MLRVIQQFKTFRPLIFQLSLSRNLSFLVGSMLSFADPYTMSFTHRVYSTLWIIFIIRFDCYIGSGQELRISMAGEKDLGAKRHGGKRGGFRKTIDLNKGTRLGDGMPLLCHYITVKPQSYLFYSLSCN